MVLATAACKKQNDRVACNNTTPTWNATVSAIVTSSCGGSSCHGSGSQSGVFTTYAGIKPFLLNGAFEQQVLDSRVMPQGATLPDATLATLQCWLENGFPES
jgi:hypothetical protein